MLLPEARRSLVNRNATRIKKEGIFEIDGLPRMHASRGQRCRIGHCLLVATQSHSRGRSSRTTKEWSQMHRHHQKLMEVLLPLSLVPIPCQRAPYSFRPDSSRRIQRKWIYIGRKDPHSMNMGHKRPSHTSFVRGWGLVCH